MPSVHRNMPSGWWERSFYQKMTLQTSAHFWPPDQKTKNHEAFDLSASTEAVGSGIVSTNVLYYDMRDVFDAE